MVSGGYLSLGSLNITEYPPLGTSTSVNNCYTCVLIRYYYWFIAIRISSSGVENLTAMSYNKREWGTAYNLLSSLIPTKSRGSTNLCKWQIAHEITYHFVFIMIITCWLLFKPDNHSHDIFQEKEGVYSTDDHKAFPQISQFSIMSMKTKCLTEGVRGRKNNFNNNSIKCY